MAKWVLMEWSGDNARPQSLYALFERGHARPLPDLGPSGEWRELRELESKLVPDAERAEQAIARAGYYLFGGQDHYATG